MGLHAEQELKALQTRNGIPTSCLDTETIERDVLRCTWHLLTGNQRMRRLQMEIKRYKKVAKLIKRKQMRLGQLIAMSLSRSYPQTAPDKLRYYQGYHDIACIILSTLGGSGLTGPWRSTLPHWSTASPGMDLSSAVLIQLSKTHLREYLREDFKPLQKILSLSFYPLLALWDPQIHDHLMEAGMSCTFILPWMITWFSHDLRDTAMVKRIFDFFIVSHPLMPLYFSLAMLLHPYNRQEILATEPDLGCLHQTLSILPRHTSRFGWKYNPIMGYVSDEGSTSTATTNSDEDEVQTFGNLEEDEVMVWHDLVEHNNNTRGPQSDTSSPVSSPVLLETGSMSSSTAGSSQSANAKVPLQELIDRAVEYMKLLPPRQIKRLATRYHGPAETQRILGGNQSSMPVWFSTKFPATSWCVAARAPSQIGNDVPSSHKTLASDMLYRDPDIVRRIVHDHAFHKAVVASGYGTSRRQMRLARKRRNRTLAVMFVGVFTAMGMAWYMTTTTHKTAKLGTPNYFFHQLVSNSTTLTTLIISLLAMTVSGYILLRK